MIHFNTSRYFIEQRLVDFLLSLTVSLKGIFKSAEGIGVNQRQW